MQVVMLRRRLLLSCRMCWFLCQLSCEKTGGMRRKWWVAEGCKRQNKLFIWVAGQYARILFASILHPRPPAAMTNTPPPQSCPVIEYLVDLSSPPPPVLSLSPPPSSQLICSISQHSYKERKEASGAFCGKCWRGDGRSRRRTFPSPRRTICSLVLCVHMW